MSMQRQHMAHGKQWETYTPFSAKHLETMRLPRETCQGSFQAAVQIWVRKTLAQHSSTGCNQSTLQQQCGVDYRQPQSWIMFSFSEVWNYIYSIYWNYSIISIWNYEWIIGRSKKWLVIHLYKDSKSQHCRSCSDIEVTIEIHQVDREFNSTPVCQALLSIHVWYRAGKWLGNSCAPNIQRAPKLSYSPRGVHGVRWTFAMYSSSAIQLQEGNISLLKQWTYSSLERPSFGACFTAQKAFDFFSEGLQYPKLWTSRKNSSAGYRCISVHLKGCR